MAASPMPPVSEPTTASAIAENEMLSPAPRPLKASPVPPRRSSFLPSSITDSSISAGDFMAGIGSVFYRRCAKAGLCLLRQRSRRYPPIVPQDTDCHSRRPLKHIDWHHLLNGASNL